MAKTPGIKERLRYGFDQTMSAGAGALVGWLALISVVVIVTAAGVLVATGIAPEGAGPLGYVEAAWEALMRTLDSGTIGGDVGWGFRMVMLVVTVAGIFVFSALIGVLTSGIESKLDELRKGRSRVIENDHTIILNWSPSVFDILGELAIANESVRRPRVVIMANKDKVEMEDEIAAKGPAMGKTRVICRSGDPTDLQDLQIVNPQASRSVIILSPDDDNPDAAVIKSIVALVHDPERRAAPYRIAAEIRNEKNTEIARAVGGAEAQLIMADDLISRIMVQSSRETGLSAVYTELLDFDGSEIYVADQPQLTGQTFGDAVLGYETSCLIGIVDAAGQVVLNPEPSRVIAPTDRAILIAEDDSAIQPLASRPVVVDAGLAPKPKVLPGPERALVLGWNRRGAMIVREMARFVPAGSTLTIAAEGETIAAEVAALGDAIAHLSVDVRPTDTTQMAELLALDVPSYDHVQVLGYSDALPAQTADTHTLVTLLHLRRIADQSGAHVKVVSEMIDVRNRQLAEVTRADDFVVSNKLVSLMLAQASENEHIAAIFGELLDADGSEVHMDDMLDLVPQGVEFDFYTVTQAASRRGHVAIGYALADGTVRVNPAKSERRAYRPGDRAIVLSHD